MDFSLILLSGAIALAILLISFLSSQAGLYLLIASILISPEFKLYELSDKTVGLRISDIIIIFVFLGLLGRLALRNEPGSFKKTPLDSSIMVFSLAITFATLLGIYRGTVEPIKSLLFLLKRLQYFFIFYIVINNIKTSKQVRVAIALFFLSTVIVDIATYYQRAHQAGSAYGTFGNPGQKNVLGSYYLMVLFLGIGLWPAYRLRSKFLIFVLFILTVPALLFTLSRGSILSFPLAFIITGLLARRFKSVFIFLIVIYLFTLTIPILPKDVAFGIHSSVRIFPGQEDPSWTARVDAWKYYLPRVNNYPIFGYGLASLPLGSVDNQYVMELLDTGIVGLGCLLWMLWRIFKSIFRIYNNTKDYFARSLSFGFLTGFVALLIHAFTITNFYTIRTMESFWFLLAITIVCSEGELEQT